MYYQTKIKKLFAGGAIDASGKRLQFIGNNPAREGDIVWTDGKVIFGHMPIRGTPLMFPQGGGIPVLGDDLRGYFTDKGKFKEYKIAEDDWIINSEKTFKHGSGNSVIDAEIAADDSGVYTAELSGNSVVLKKDGVTTNTISLDDNEEFINIKLNNNGGYELIKYFVSEENTPRTVSVSSIWNVSTFEETYNKQTFLAETEFPFIGEETGDDPYLHKALMALWEYCLFGEYDDETGEYSYSNRINYVGAYAHTYPNGSMKPVPILVTNYDYEIEAKVIRERNGAEEVLRSYKRNDVEGSYAGDEIKESEINRDRVVACVILSADGEEIIGVNSAGLTYPNGSKRAPGIVMTYEVETDDTGDSDTSIGEGYRIYNFFEDTPKEPYHWINSVEDDGVTYRFLFSGGEMGDENYGYGTVFLSRSGKYEYSKDGAEDHPSSSTKSTSGDDEYNFPIQDGYYVSYEFDGLDCKMKGIFDRGGNKICGKMSALSPAPDIYNLSITPLGKNAQNGYLVGIHGGGLHKVKDGKLEKVGDSLKNFRLREMKKISRTKK